MGQTTRSPFFKIIINQIGTLRCDDGDCNGNVNKAIGLKASNNSARTLRFLILWISLPSLHDYGVKMPDLPSMEDASDDDIFFFLRTWTLFLWIQLQESSPTFNEVSELECCSQFSISGNFCFSFVFGHGNVCWWSWNKSKIKSYLRKN